MQGMNLNTNQQQQQQHRSLTILITFILSFLSVQCADKKQTKISDIFCFWGGKKCGPLSACEMCYYTVGAYMPMCCGGKRNYGSYCFAQNCAKEDMKNCRYGYCGDNDIFLELKPGTVQDYPARRRRRRLLGDDPEDQCKESIEELCDQLGEDLCEKLGIDEDLFCKHVDEDDDDDDRSGGNSGRG